MAAMAGFVASAPGKIILCGEHAVVHGKAALATVVERRTWVEVTPLDEGQFAARSLALSRARCRAQRPSSA